MSKVVLIVAAHPDDEVLGCGGTIALHLSEGDSVHTVFMADGVTSRGESNAVVELEVRNQAAQHAAKKLGISTPLTFLGFPDNRMDTVSLLDITQALEKVISNIKPQIIYTHHYGDLNIDHQITHKAVMTSCRPQPDFCVKEIYAFEVLSSTEWQVQPSLTFIPNIFVNISDYISSKEKALSAYHEEMRSPPHSRSIENAIRYAALRGNSVGVEYAEAFQLLRLIK